MSVAAKNARPGRPFPRLFMQLVAANVVAAGTVAAMVYGAFRMLANMYFDRLMREFNITPTELNAMFIDDLQNILILAVVVALAVGFVLAFLLTKAILRPLGRMAQAATEIGGGDLKTRVAGVGGELEQLARQFNAMADALERHEESRRQLMRDLSHELRTPLTNLKGHLEGLEDGVFEPNPQVLGVLSDEVARLNLLIDDLTEHSSADEVASRLTIEDVDLHAEINRAFVGRQGGLKEKGLTFRIDRPAGHALVRADSLRLRQVLENVLANIVQHTAAPERATAKDATIRVFFQDGARNHVTVCFENPSAPIGEAQLARLFDRLYRVDQTRSGGAQGSGLGLSIVKRLIEAQGGAVWARYDRGRFQLWLQLLAAD